MTVPIRPEQANALGGCAPCQFEPGPGSAADTGASKRKPGAKSVIIVDPTKTDTFIAIELVDQTGRPVPDAAFEVTPPGMATVKGTLDANGKARIEGINPGTCQVVFPAIDRRDFV